MAPVLAVGRTGYFYPRSPCGERPPVSVFTSFFSAFYPRSPCGERPVVDNIILMPREFLSTLSLRRATRLGLLGWLRVLISIHALLAESDGGFGAGSWRLVIFLSTLSLRRATTDGLFFFSGRENFYPRSPCGERRGNCPSGFQRPYISIHALLAESDCVPLVGRS